MKPTPTLDGIEHTTLATTLANVTEGLVLVGTEAEGGRTTIAAAAARFINERDGGTVAIVGPSPTEHEVGSQVLRVPVLPTSKRAEIDGLHHAIQNPDVKTIVYDALPQIGGIAYASALARSGWLVILTLPSDQITTMVEILINSQEIACYQGFTDGSVLAAEDIVSALVSATTQRTRIGLDGRPDFVGEHLEFNEDIKALIVQEQRDLLMAASGETHTKATDAGAK